MNNHEQLHSTNDNSAWENISNDVEPRFEVQNRVAEKFKSGKAKETLMRALKATLIAAGVAATVFMSKGETPANNAPTAISQEVEPASPAADPVNKGNAEFGSGRNISESDHLPSHKPESPNIILPGEPEPKQPEDHSSENVPPSTEIGESNIETENPNAQNPNTLREAEQLEMRLSSISPNKVAPNGPGKYIFDRQYRYEVTRDGKVLTEDGVELNVDLGPFDHFPEYP